MTRSWRAGAVSLVGLLALAACVVGGGGGYVQEGYGYGGDFYEPGGYVVGGWGPGYRVGPPGRGWHGPGIHPAPSIPSGPRRGGGGHGFGGGRPGH